MPGFVRRFTFAPGVGVIRRIEGPVIIDLAPPAPAVGAGSGTTLAVGEFEDGFFATDPESKGSVEVFGSEDLRQKFGGFGFTYDNVPSSNPASRRHLSEFWNGNGFIKLFKLRAQRLQIARVDTSVGEVTFDTLACLTGNAGPFVMIPGQVISFTTDAGGPALSDAIAAVVATVVGAGAAFGSVASGDTFGMRVDGGVQVDITFGAADTTIANVVTRINNTLGFASAVDNAGQLDLRGIVAGTSGSVELIEVTPGVLAKLGHAAGSTAGTGNVGDVNAVTVTEINAVVNGTAGLQAINVQATVGPANTMRVCNSVSATASSLQVNPTPATQAIETGSGGTYPTGFAGGETLNLVVDSIAVPVVFTAGASLLASVITEINAEAATQGLAPIAFDNGGELELRSIATGSSAELTVNTGTANGTLGLPAGSVTTNGTDAGLEEVLGFGSGNQGPVTAASNPGGTIPAGTRVRDTAPTPNEWVTMQTLDIPAGGIGPFKAKVRPALDDGTAPGAGASQVTVLVDPTDVGELTVTNALALSAALTEPQMDARYVAALNATLNPQGVASQANYLLSARRSDTVVREGRANVLKATECGLFARKFITGDPLGTSTSQILANVANFRSDRVFYTGKGLLVNIPQIAERGVDGGLGFTADGNITVRPDGPLATICAIRPPEENPGQQTNLIDSFFEVETAGETLTVEQYEAFKAGGVAVPILDQVAGMTFESGVTSSLDPARLTMARRKMADFIQDTAAVIMLPFIKKLNRQSRRDKIRGIWEDFLAGLQSENNAALARIDSFFVDDSENAGNTAQNLALGIYFIQTSVRNLSSLDNAVMQTEIGESAVTNLEL